MILKHTINNKSQRRIFLFIMAWHSSGTTNDELVNNLIGAFLSACLHIERKVSVSARSNRVMVRV